MIAQRDMREGLHHRRVLGHRHRRHGGDRGRDGPAVRRRARALREARGRAAHARRQGQQAGRAWSRGNLRRGHAGPRRVPLFVGYDVDDAEPGPAGRIVTFDAAGGWNFDEERLPVGRLRLGVRQVVAQEAVRPESPTPDGAADRRRGALRRRRRRLRHRRARTWCAGSSRPSSSSSADGAVGIARASASPSWPREVVARPYPRLRLSAPMTRRRNSEIPVLHLAEQVMRDRSRARPQGHRPGPQRRGADLRRRRAVRRGEPVAALHKVVEIYDRIGFAAVGRYNEFDNLRRGGIQLADLRGYAYDRRDVTGRAAGQRLRADARHHLHRADQALRGRAVPGRGRHRRTEPTSSTGSPTTARSPTSRSSWSWAAPPSRSPTRSRTPTPRTPTCPMR